MRPPILTRKEDHTGNQLQHDHGVHVLLPEGEFSDHYWGTSTPYRAENASEYHAGSYIHLLEAAQMMLR